MGQIDLAVKYSKRIETILEKNFSAEGKGLHEKLHGLEKTLGQDIIKKARHIATIRNKVVHEDDYEIDDIEKFIEIAKDVILSLENHRVEISNKNYPTNPDEDFTFDCGNINNSNNKGSIKTKQSYFQKFLVTITRFIIFMIASIISSIFLYKLLDGSGLEIIPILFFILSPLIFIYINTNRIIDRIPTFDGYIQRYPGFLQNGRIICNKCGSDNIHKETRMDILSPMQDEHRCRTCGTILCRSIVKFGL